MFDLLRKMILPIIITVLVLFAGMIVLEWGMGLSGRGGGLDNPGNMAGMVNGESITYEDYSQVLNNLYEQERQNRGVDYEIPEERERQLEQQAWNDLVADRIIKQEGAKMKISVSDADVYNYLKTNPPTFLRHWSAHLTSRPHSRFTRVLVLSNAVLVLECGPVQPVWQTRANWQLCAIGFRHAVTVEYEYEYEYRCTEYEYERQECETRTTVPKTGRVQSQRFYESSTDEDTSIRVRLTRTWASTSRCSSYLSTPFPHLPS